MSDIELISAVAGRVAAIEGRASRDLLYDATGNDEFNCSDWREAVCELLDSHIYPGISAAEELQELAEMGAVELDIYERDAHAKPGFAMRSARNAVEHAIELWDEDYGGPDGYDTERGAFSVEAFNACVTEVSAAFDKMAATQAPWRCTKIGTVTISPEELAALARDHGIGVEPKEADHG